MKSVHFGAGNIGRGFIGDLLHDSGYEITFVEVSDKIVRQLNQDKSYRLYILNENKKEKIIHGVEALNPLLDEEAVIDRICKADLITTSVWADNLPKIAPVLAKGLRLRYNRGLSPVNVIACENALFASNILRDLLAKSIPVEILEEIAKFANTAVDRLALAAKNNGKDVVEIDSMFELIIEETPLLRKEPIKGAIYVERLQPYLERKLYIVNCGHAALAYLGFVKGYKTVQEAIKDPGIKDLAVKAMEESAVLLHEKYGFSKESLAKKIEESVERFSATYVMDDVHRVCRSPLRKLDPTDRLVAPAVQLEERGFNNEALAQVIAAVLHYENDADIQAKELKESIAEKGVEQTLATYTGISPESKLYKQIIHFYYEY